MNKRQKKKAFKRKYGFNPPNKYKQQKIAVRNSLKILEEGIKNIKTVIQRLVSEMFDVGKKTFEDKKE